MDRKRNHNREALRAIKNNQKSSINESNNNNSRSSNNNNNSSGSGKSSSSNNNNNGNSNSSSKSENMWVFSGDIFIKLPTTTVVQTLSAEQEKLDDDVRGERLIDGRLISS